MRSVCGVWFWGEPLREGGLPGDLLLYSKLPDELAEVAPVQRDRVCQLKDPDRCKEVPVVSSDGSSLLLSSLLQYPV
eukprot:5500119-Pyramimonas_sp.AAC.1